MSAVMHTAEAPPLTLSDINRLDRVRFVAALGGLFEHSPWVATPGLGRAALRQRSTRCTAP